MITATLRAGGTQALYHDQWGFSMSTGNVIRRRAQERNRRYIEGMIRGPSADPDLAVLKIIADRKDEGAAEASQPRAAVIALLEQGYLRRGRRAKIPLLFVTDMGKTLLRQHAV